MRDDGFQIRHGPIVHEGCAVGEIAKPWCFEGMAGIIAVACNAGATYIIRIKTNVMKSVVGEIPSGVAARATCLADKEFKPLLCFAGDGVFIAVDPAVEGGCAGDDGSLDRKSVV